MGSIVVTEYVSLDGVIEGPGGGEDYEHVGWTFEVNRGEEGDQFKLDETLTSEALLLGGVTYEVFAAAWPSMTGALADKLNSMPKYVVSSTISHGSWNNTAVVSGDVRRAVIDLTRRIDGDIVVHGSAQLVHALLEEDLVDELRLMGVPHRAGHGQAALRRDHRQEADAARRIDNSRRRHHHPHPPARRMSARPISRIER